MRSEPYVIHEGKCEIESWEDATRGEIQWRTLLSADRTPTTSMTLGVAEIKPGGRASLREHRHAQPEIYYILSGSGVVTIDRREHFVRTGTAVFIPGHAEHAVRNTGTKPLHFVYVFPIHSFDEVEYEFTDA